MASWELNAAAGLKRAVGLQQVDVQNIFELQPYRRSRKKHHAAALCRKRTFALYDWCTVLKLMFVYDSLGLPPLFALGTLVT